ncbi:DUF4012 domain-containing protein [Kineococcus sp. R8]|nr:DUF4012 domain-containing protein [Kineococcus siccus]
MRLVLGVVLLLLVAWGVAVAVSGVQAGRALLRVSSAAPALEDDLRAERFAAARPGAQRIADDAATAARATGQWPWRAAERVPWVGAQLRAVGGASSAAALLTQPLPAALGVADDALGDGLVSAEATVDVAALQQLTPVVTDYAQRLPRARADLAAATAPEVLDVLARRLEPVAAQLDRVAGPLATAAEVAPQVPALLGAQGPRTYLVAFTNPAEIRPVQGIVGAYAVLRVDAGRIELVGTGSDDDLYGARADPRVLGPEYTALYGDGSGDDDAGTVQNVTVGAQADDAGRLTADLFASDGRPRPDAVVFVDPVGLAALLGPEHPPLDLGPFGQVATRDLPDVLMRQAYVRYGEDQDARKLFLTVTSAAAFQAVLADGLSTAALQGGREAVRTGHLSVWSADPAAQAALVAAGVAGVLGDPAGSTTAHLGLTNVAPSKLDYFVQPTVVVEPPCAPAGADAASALQLTLRSDVPEVIPDYMRNALADTPLGERTAREVVSLWVPPWVGLDGVTLDGAPVATAVDAEHGWRLVRLTVDVPPAQDVVVRWSLRGDAAALPRSVTGPATAAAPVVTEGPCTPTG